MQRRIIAAVAAVILAGIGAVLLYSYVNTAEARAMSKMETTDVLVATKLIPAGTLGSDLAPFVEVKKLPQVAVPITALKNTTDITTMAAVSDIQIGEQILPTRFASPDTTAVGEVDVPADMQQVSVPLEAPRVVGGQVKAGDRVGVFFSGDDTKNNDKITALQLRGVLVVKIQGGAVTNGDTTAAPTGTEVVTLALKPNDATRVVYGIENAKIWLALEPKDGGNGTNVVTSRTVLK